MTRVQISHSIDGTVTAVAFDEHGVLVAWATADSAVWARRKLRLVMAAKRLGPPGDLLLFGAAVLATMHWIAVSLRDRLRKNAEGDVVEEDARREIEAEEEPEVEKEVEEEEEVEPTYEATCSSCGREIRLSVFLEDLPECDACLKAVLDE